MAAVLPEAAAEAGGEDDEQARVAEVGLAAGERLGELPAGKLLESLEQLERMVAAVVVVEPGLDAVDVDDERVRLDRVQPAARPRGSATTPRSASGSSRSPSGVESATSQKTSVTVFRTMNRV